MMDHMAGMMVGMGLLGWLLIVVLVLVATAAIKYLFFDGGTPSRLGSMMNRRTTLLAAGGFLLGLSPFLNSRAQTSPMAEGMMGSGHSMMRQMMQEMMGAALPPGIDPELLPEPQSQGARVLQHYCAQCHGLPGPGMHTAGEWPAVVDRMNRRMQMMNGMMQIEVPTSSELTALVAYLQEHAQRPLDPATYPDLATPPGQKFRATCSQCHALPDPRQHTAQEWPAVVERMQKNMTAMGKAAPDTAETKAIIGFLRRHAREAKEK